MGRQRDLGAQAQIEETSLGRPSITDIKVKTLFGGNNGHRHSPGVRRVAACLRSQNPPLTAESLDYQTNRCKPQRTMSSAALRGESSEGLTAPTTPDKETSGANVGFSNASVVFLHIFQSFELISGLRPLQKKKKKRSNLGLPSNGDLLCRQVHTPKQTRVYHQTCYHTARSDAEAEIVHLRGTNPWRRSTCASSSQAENQ